MREWNEGYYENCISEQHIQRTNVPLLIDLRQDFRKNDRNLKYKQKEVHKNGKQRMEI